MQAELALVLVAVGFSLAACSKSSPPPQQPVKPRSIASMVMPLRLPAP